MMKYSVVFIVVMLTLPFNVFADCLNASDIMEEDIIDIIPADPKKIKARHEKGCSKNWVISQIPLTDVKRHSQIFDKGVNLCAKSSTKGESESVEKALLSLDPPYHVPLNFMQYDGVKVSYVAHLNGIITAEVCDGADPNVKVFDVNFCKTALIGSHYSSIISNDINSPSSNVLNYKGVDTSHWIKAPLYVINGTDAKNSKFFKAQKVLAKEVKNDHQKYLNYVCRYNPADTSLSSTLKESIEDIRMGMDSFTINKLCGNICSVRYDKHGSVTEVVDANCVYSLTTEFENKQGVAYFPGLYLYEQGHSGSAVPEAKGNLSLKGIELNKEYQLNAANPNITLGIPQGRTGGYKVSIARKCTYHNKRSLYYYIGTVCPTMDPGDAGTTQIPMMHKGDYTDTVVFPLDPAWHGQNIYYGVKDNGDGTDNNFGHFEIKTRVPKEIKTPFGSMVKWLSDQVHWLLYGDNSRLNKGAVGTIYYTFRDAFFVTVLRSLLVLYISVYSMMYLMGMIRSSQVEAVVMFVKIGVIITLLNPGSWDFFNNNLFMLFKEGSIDLIHIMSDHSSSKSGQAGEIKSDFKFIDHSLARFAQLQTWMQIFSLIFTGPVGFICAFAVVWSVWMLFLAFIRASVIFIISIIVVALLLSIAPLFITLALFKRTKVMFDNWIKILAGTAMQPVMIFAALAILNQVLMSISYHVFAFDLCLQCVAKLTLADDMLSLFCLFKTYLPRGYIPTATYAELAEETYHGFSLFGVPIPLATLMAFVIVTHTVSTFVEKVPEIISSMFSMMMTELSHPARKFEDSMRSIVGQDHNTQYAKAQQNYMNKLHDVPPKNKDSRDSERRKEVGKK